MTLGQRGLFGEQLPALAERLVDLCLDEPRSEESVPAHGH